MLVVRAMMVLCLLSVSPLFAQLDGWEEDTEYSDLVAAEQWSDALRYMCAKFRVSCSDIYIDARKNPDVRAITNATTNNITLYTNAFSFFGRPHPGWLAAIVHHERVHQRQPQVRRTIVWNLHRLIGDHSIDASLEYEAWYAMLNVRHRYGLSCQMILEINQQLYYYGAVLSRQGRIPKDEDSDEELNFYTTSPRFDRLIISTCKREKEQLAMN